MTAGQESAVEAGKVLEKYRSRQVVLNYYHGELLEQREGFFFDSLTFKGDKLIFHRKNGPYLLNLDSYREFHVLPSFNHYYRFTDGDHFVELYFPY